MKQKYNIKGIEKILQTISKEELARYYGVDTNADFEQVIAKSLEERGIPNNSEIGLCVHFSEEEYIKRKTPLFMAEATEFYEKDERKRVMYRFNYIGMGGALYFVVDEPIKESDLEKIWPQPSFFCGGCSYNGLLMGTKYYEEHKKELDESYEVNSKPIEDKIDAVDSYIEDFLNEFKDVEYTGGFGPRGKYKETDQIREKRTKNEEIILSMTGKNSIEELSLRDFIKIKRELEKRKKELEKALQDRFTAGRND